VYTVDDEIQSVWDGERLETTRNDGVAVEHLHRYAITLGLVQGKDVLDLASGEGYGSNLISSAANSVIGVDISEEAINHARKKYKKENLKFLQGSADKVPVESGSIDVVVSFETIEHHDKHDEMMLEIKRVLKKDGILIISSPDKLNYTDIPRQHNPYHVKELYLDEFKSLVSKYFLNSRVMLQKMVYASVIVPEDHPEDFKEYSGTYDSIQSSSHLQSPLYGICIASDANIDKVESSVFDGKEVLDRLFSIRERKADSLAKKSIQYKIGKFAVYPARLFRRLFRVF
jgi:ubiquinone/menaquinone biosynthesis C-methylase UbiE